MKTFTEFLEEAYLAEMRKEDKVKGEKRTPLYKTLEKGKVTKNPEGSDTKWKVEKSERTGLTPRASTGRLKQGMANPLNKYGQASTYGATRHAHGGGGSGAQAPGILRGKKKVPGEKTAPPIGHRTPAQKVELKRAQVRRKSLGY